MRSHEFLTPDTQQDQQGVMEAKESIKDQIEKAVIIDGGNVDEYFVRSANIDKLGYSAKQTFGRSPDIGDDNFSIDYIGNAKGKPALWFYPLSYYLKNSGEAYATDMPHVWLVRIKPDAWLQPVNSDRAVKQDAPIGKERVGILRKSAVPAAIFFKPAFTVVDKFYDYGSQHKKHSAVKEAAEGLDEAESHTPASKEIRTSLRKSGYKLLGSGADATVWAKRAGPVIKIIMPDSGHGAGHTGDTFMKFYEFCKHNSELQNLPKFSDPPAEEFKIGHKKYIAVFMERLSPIPVGSFQEAMVWILSELATRPISWRQALRIVGYKKTWKHYHDGMHPHHILQTLAELSQEELLEYEVLFKLMTLLYHKGKINKTGWDLHTENAMMRDGTIVITDPWFTSKI